MITTTEVGDNHMLKESGAINGRMMKRSTPTESPVIVVNVLTIDDYLMDIDKFGHCQNC